MSVLFLDLYWIIWMWLGCMQQCIYLLAFAFSLFFSCFLLLICCLLRVVMLFCGFVCMFSLVICLLSFSVYPRLKCCQYLSNLVLGFRWWLSVVLIYHFFAVQLDVDAHTIKFNRSIDWCKPLLWDPMQSSTTKS